MFRYTTWEGKRKQVKKSGFATKREAQAYERDFMQRVSGSPDMLFKNLWEIYKQDYQCRVKKSSYISAVTNFEKRVLPSFENMPVNQITANDVRKWERELQSKNELAPASIQSLHGHLSSVLHFAQKFYGLPTNAATIAGYSVKIESKPNELHFWTVEQFKKFDAAAQGDEPFRTLFLLLFWSGIRVGEAMALTIGDIDFDEGTINISKTYHRFDKQDIVTAPKTPNSNRVVPIPSQLLDVLREFIKHIPHATKKTRLFESAFVVKTVRNHFYQITEKAGLPRIKVHDLRHSHASMLIQQNVPPIVIRDRMGHKSIQTTLDIYSHLYPTKGGEIADILSNIW